MGLKLYLQVYAKNNSSLGARKTITVKSVETSCRDFF